VHVYASGTVVARAMDEEKARQLINLLKNHTSRSFMHRMWNLHGTVPQPRYQRQCTGKDRLAKCISMWKYVNGHVQSVKFGSSYGIIVHIATVFL